MEPKSEEEYNIEVESNRKLREEMIEHFKGYDDYEKIKKYLPTLEMLPYAKYLENFDEIYSLPHSETENGILESKNEN